ncbi:MAG: cell wall-binding repeat-containing protein, partial [Pseudoclavibacter sp.]|nr:cell wall-binding repeat-containing protein [Pseudoclavibacter sp.]
MRRLHTLAAGLVAAAVLATGLTEGAPPAAAATSASYEPLVAAGYAARTPQGLTVDGARVAADAAALPIVDSSVLGYDRRLFPHWSDLDGDRCRTREEILARDMSGIVLAANGCSVQSGTLQDAYTGQTISYRRGASTSSAVHIDHIVALSSAWTGGAHGWDPATRERFANDPANLLAVEGRANQAKSDRGPSEWLPANTAFLCVFVASYTNVLRSYGLAVTAADRDALVREASKPECAAGVVQRVPMGGGQPPAEDPAEPGEPSPTTEPSAPGAAPGEEALPERIAGPDRFATAAAVAARFPAGGTIVVATGENYADALAAGPVAGRLAAPILLVRREAVPDVVREAVAAAAPARILIVGSVAAVGAEVERTLGEIAPAASVERFGGADRHETAALLAGAFFPEAPGALIATGWDFPDALSASAAGAARGLPVLLGSASELTRPTRTALEGIGGLREVHLVGGPNVLAPDAAAELAGAPVAVERLSGADRFATAAALVDRFFPEASGGLVVRADNWPDALVAAPLAARTGRPLLLSLAECTG